ncbi:MULTISPECIES: globin domain-containing protein [Streptomyces]|uniref:nitric oxide dioxygenase n=4 Tax=Streptomyces TaxID=1883 RepID=A0A8H9LRB0_9ACTN|nr:MULTISPECIES: globin domain-containing protein [Streptomyces]NEE41139.1 flavohemoprotein [Streptomyces sp. SID7982]NEE44074.1 flavohemoprotein [Streptomyces sp. SID8455]MBL3808103.1 flavohemoprotein [Streptomyces sp. BRB081]QNE79931.1 flavohemoprotein [Streptomyces rutgersensis]RPK83744.1 Phenol hydroxylase P5 protein [Streptomyces sp. ADI98-12]
MPRPAQLSGSTSTENGAYHALLARHDAMRLRQQLLAPAGSEEPGGGRAARRPAGEVYDGAADQRVIMRHLELVAPFEELITHLYEVLFTRHPALRGLFPGEMAFQEAHLARAFWYLLEHLDRPEEITETFTRLGRDHRKLGVRPAQYAAFEEALRAALRARAGERGSARLEEAWLRMVRFGVTAMIQGADAALHEPPFWRATVTEHRLIGSGLAVLRVVPHESFRYEAGQYTAVESPLLPHTWRPYYLAGEPGADGELELHVRCTGPGGVSEALVRGTAAGDEVRLGPPRGNLTLGEEPVGDLRLVAWDTGWATMKALLAEVDRRVRLSPGHGVRTVRLFLGAENAAALYDTEYLTGLERRRPWLSVVPVTGPAADGDGYGRLAAAVARDATPSPGKVLLSGPPAMIRTVLDALPEAGVAAADVRHDLQPTGPRFRHGAPEPGRPARGPVSAGQPSPF